MKAFILKSIKKVLTPSFRTEMRHLVAYLRERIDLARFWNWEIVNSSKLDNSQFHFKYIGRKKYRKLASTILGIDFIPISKSADSGDLKQIVVGEAPMLGALKVPKYLRAIVPLRKPIEEIISKFDSELRRTIRKNRPLYSMRRALIDSEIDFAWHEFLLPYAIARYGNSAVKISREDVHRMAKEYGRLDFVRKGDEIVACLLGFEYARNGKRYWQIERYGYPEAVFSDPKRLGEINTMNNHLGMEWASINGYDFYDMTSVIARPDDGLLKWKKRRGGILSTTGMSGYSSFYIRLPKEDAAKFLWNTPIFSTDGKDLILHLGLPDELPEGEFMSRYREMGFPELHEIYLHCNSIPSESILRSLANLYKNSPPHVEYVLSS